MNAKEYSEMRKLAKKALSGEEFTVEDAVMYLLLIEMSQTFDIVKVCQSVIRKDAAGRKKTYEASLGTIDIGEPYARSVNEEDFKRDKPDAYREIIARKAENLHVTIDDLDNDDQKKYVHFVKGTAKVRVHLA